jgi:hypothetical protein
LVTHHQVESSPLVLKGILEREGKE